MNDKLRELLNQLNELEDQIQTLLQEQQQQLMYRIEGRKVRFEEGVRKAHRELKTRLLPWLLSIKLRHLVTGPFVYSMIVPFVLLDLVLSLYQWVSFPMYRIAKVKRRHYIVIDRHQLDYLNIFEKINCVYCSYGNGLLAYGLEIGARTEQYWCPIKHAQKIRGRHSRYVNFLDYGDAEAYQEGLEKGREAMAKKAGLD